MNPHIENPMPPSYQQVEQMAYKEKLEEVKGKYEIGVKFSEKLQTLMGFKIVFIFDDSGSMASKLKDSPLNTPYLNVSFSVILLILSKTSLLSNVSLKLT